MTCFLRWTPPLLFSDSSTPLQLGGPEARGGFMGLYARVVEVGQVETGDSIELLDG